MSSFIGPKYTGVQLANAAEKEFKGMVGANFDSIMQLLNGKSPSGSVPSGLVISIANEGVGPGEVYDTTSGGIAYLRTLTSTGTYAAGLTIANSTNVIAFTLVPSAIPLSAFAAASANISMGGFKITSLGNGTSSTDAVNMTTMWKTVAARIAVRV